MEADQARIFERFERAVSVRNFGGLGLGLYMVRSIGRRTAGSIRVESKPSAGATFVVELLCEPAGGGGERRRAGLAHRSRWSPEESTEWKRNRRGASARWSSSLVPCALAPLRFLSVRIPCPWSSASWQLGWASQLIESKQLSTCSVL